MNLGRRQKEGGFPVASLRNDARTPWSLLYRGVDGCSLACLDLNRGIVDHAGAVGRTQCRIEQPPTRRYPLEQINEAYQALLSGEVARSVVIPGGIGSAAV